MSQGCSVCSEVIGLVTIHVLNRENKSAWPEMRLYDFYWKKIESTALEAGLVFGRDCDRFVMDYRKPAWTGFLGFSVWVMFVG